MVAVEKMLEEDFSRVIAGNRTWSNGKPKMVRGMPKTEDD